MVPLCLLGTKFSVTPCVIGHTGHGNMSVPHNVPLGMTSSDQPAAPFPTSTARGALVSFELTRTVALEPQASWHALTDWKGHEGWIPMTRVDVVSQDPDAFVAFSGPGKLALEDRMTVTESLFDGHDGRCHVIKHGPVLVGEAEFSVRPGLKAGTTDVTWRESVRVPLLPRFLSPVVARIGSALFSHSLGRMERHALR